jgi:hypothetical protein
MRRFTRGSADEPRKPPKSFLGSVASHSTTGLLVKSFLALVNQIPNYRNMIQREETRQHCWSMKTICLEAVNLIKPRKVSLIQMETLLRHLHRMLFL